MHECMCVYMRYCLCASLPWHPAQGEGLILCGLERINFVLTLAVLWITSVSASPPPPWGQAEEKAGVWRWRKWGREGVQEREGSRDSKKCHFRKGLYSLFTTISPFYELAPLQLLFKYVYCVSLCVCVCESVRVYQGQTECVFFPWCGLTLCPGATSSQTLSVFCIFPLPSVLSAAHGKVFAVQLCKQPVLSLSFSASVSYMNKHRRQQA